MQINATLPDKGRDLRLDLFRGVANWAIYLDHIPDNVVNWITTRNYEFNVAGLVDNATETLRQGLFLKFKPLNLDVLPLYIVLMGLFPPVLWMMLRQPNWTMLASIALWLVSRQMGWNLPAYPAGTWYF